MTDYQWTGVVSQTASVAGNWIPTSGPPGASDKAIFDAAAVANCNFDIANINEIELQSTFALNLILATDIDLNGLTISVAGKIIAASARGFVFTGTPPYKSGTCYVQNGTTDSPFDTTASRENTTYTMAPASGDLYFDTGIYPNVKLGGNGNKTPQFVSPTVANTTNVNFNTLRISSGTFGPASPIPTDNDKLKNFIIDSSSSQLTIDAGGLSAFDGGHATWTFQGKSSGFLIPTSNLADYQKCDFTFRRMSIVATADGAGAWAKLNANSRLYLTNLTIGVGASLKGAGACAIHLINRPTIKGTWGFFPIADGIYHPKEGEVIGVANGGTGLSDITQYQIPFGGDGNALTTSSRLTFNNSTNVFAIDGKLDVSGLIDPTGLELTPVSSNPGGVAANTLWLNSSDSNKLYHGSSEVAGGGGGGSGDITAVNVSAPITGGGASGDVSIGISAATTSAAGSMSSADKTKLDGIESGATNTPALQHMRLFLKNLSGNAANYVVSGAYTVLDIANTTNWGESTTGAHPAITLVNDTNDHITLTKGGIYQIVFQVEFFPATSTQSRDMWAVISTDASSTGQLGTDRIQVLNNGVGNKKLTHTVIYEIPNGGSDTSIFFSLRSNGQNSNIIAFNDNRSSITITRLGDAIS